MKNGSARRLFAILVLCMFMLSSADAWGCTTLVAGKNASATGRPIFSRTEDSMSYGAKRFFVYPAAYYKKGQTIVNPLSGWSWTWTHDSYKMTAAPDMPINEEGIFDAEGVNERGFMMSASDAITNSAGARAADPLPSRGGFGQALLTTVMLGEAASSEEALTIWGSIVEKDGMSDNNFWMMCDSKDELWITENCGGHRWAAARVPDDCFAAIANDNIIDYVDLSDTKNFRGSKDLIEWAISHDFALYGASGTPEEGKVSIAGSYGTQNGTSSSYRRWMGYNMFAPSQNIKLKAAYNATVVSADPYPYKTFIKPDKKISALDIMEFQRSRFEGTPYDISDSPQYFATTVVPGGVNMYRESENAQIENVNSPGTTTSARPIGHITQMEAHIYELLGFPPEIGVRWWFQQGQTEHSVNLPLYGNINDTHPAYKKDVPYRAYDPESAFWIFREVSYLARSNRKQYGRPIHDYWRAYETKLYNDQTAITKELLERHNADPKDASQWITEYTIATSQAAMNRAGLFRKALLKHIDTRSGDLFVVPGDSVPFTNGTFDIHPTAGTANLTATDIYDAANIMGISEWTVKPAYLKLPSPYPPQRFTPILYTVEDLETGRPATLGDNASVLSIPGVRVYANLQSPDLSAGNLVKVRYTAEIQGENYKKFENSLEKVKKGFSLHAMLPGYKGGFELVGPNGLVSLSDAVKTGKASAIGDKERATVIIDFYLYDDAGAPAYGSGGKIVVPDGKFDNVLDTCALWAAAYSVDDNGGGDDDDCKLGCQAFAPGALLWTVLMMGLLFRRMYN